MKEHLEHRLPLEFTHSIMGINEVPECRLILRIVMPQVMTRITAEYYPLMKIGLDFKL